MSDEREVPGGRLGRMARLAALGARTGAGLILDKSGEGAAQAAADVLGTMRGLAAKVGQMASYVDGIVPEAQRDAYEAALKGLRTAAPTSSPDAVRAMVEEELGAPIDRLFATFEPKPFASASIGQVHRATLADGVDVAVKVQHPGIARAMESDLKNAGMVELLKRSMLGAKFESKRIFAEVADRFREELDYRLEAERQIWFRDFHADHPRIHIPRVVTERSTARVLTTELATGAELDAVTTASEAERRAWAETLWRFVFRGTLVGGKFNADPHPGNYLFRDDGRVTFMDFGCVVVQPDDRRERARRLHVAAIDRDMQAFRASACALLETKGGRFEDMTVAYMEEAFAPLLRSPFRITRAYASGLLERMIEAAKIALKIPKHEFAPMPPGMVLMNRLQFGFYSVLARLDVEVDYAAVEREFLEA